MEWREYSGNEKKAPRDNANISYLGQTVAALEAGVYALTTGIVKTQKSADPLNTPLSQRKISLMVSPIFLNEGRDNIQMGIFNISTCFSNHLLHKIFAIYTDYI